VIDMDWGTVLSLAGLFALGFGYLARQINRVEDNLSKRIDQLTERYITHLEHHPR
jgi:hypothetical protein